MPEITLAVSVDADKFHGLVERLEGAGININADTDVIPDLKDCRSSNVVTGRGAEAARARINDYLNVYQSSWRPIIRPFTDMNPEEKAAFLNFATRDCHWTDEEPAEVEEIIADVYERFCASQPRLFIPEPYDYAADGTYLAVVKSAEPPDAGRIGEFLAGDPENEPQGRRRNRRQGPAAKPENRHRRFLLAKARDRRTFQHAPAIDLRQRTAADGTQPARPHPRQTGPAK